ncbi:hypothetical protein K435DRAFT_776710 [Dendrothele bispora CBS 962.96]|uniref:Uncharacterized protein n=1 Tax=Dendrothele bispora (strain CBS 962.96) TaxID=1314807 RepID=A0A4S8MCT9_DENBC|nr:hypothetical protein K435DRAFT_776710 [Dendrothele bispora CBS 962.96]
MASLDGTPDTAHTRHDLFGYGGSTFSGSSGSHGSHGGSGGGGDPSPMESLVGSGTGAGSKRSNNGFPRAGVVVGLALAGGGLEGKMLRRRFCQGCF